MALDVDVVECHGSGRFIADAIEAGDGLGRKSMGNIHGWRRWDTSGRSSGFLPEPRKKPQCIVYVRELYYITFAKEKWWVAKDRESNLLRERSRKRSLRYFKLFVLFSGNGPLGSWHRRYSGSLGSQLWESGVAARVVKCVEDCSQSSI